MGLEISLLCDRKTTNVAKSQLGFADFVVLPYFDALTKVLPRMQFTVDQMKINKEEWIKLVDEYERQREETENASLWERLREMENTQYRLMIIDVR